MQSADAMGSEAMAKKQFGARLYTIQKGTGWNFRKARKMAVEILTQFKEGQVESGPPVQRVVCSRAISPCY